MSRPERTSSAEAFYSRGEAQRYDDSARMSATQRALADRALQLLDLPPNVPALLLDAGCGTGYSGRPLEKAGHTWIGTDISMNMLRAGVEASIGRKSGRNQVICDDLGHGFAFRNGVFDGCISISAVQWLCHASKAEHDPSRRVRKFFIALRAVLAAGARAVLQLYPEQPAHMQMLKDAALSAGFGGGLIVDYPWSERSKKLFLVLIAPSRLPAAGAAPTSAQAAAVASKQRHGGGTAEHDGKRHGKGATAKGGGGNRDGGAAMRGKGMGKGIRKKPKISNGRGGAGKAAGRSGMRMSDDI